MSPPAADPAGAPGAILAWAGILLAAAGVWIDLLLETDAAGATALFQQARGLPPGGPPEMTAFCSSVHASLCEVVLAQLRGSRTEFYVPFDPVVPGTAATPFLRSLTQRTGRSHRFEVEGIRIAVTLLASPSPLQAKRSEQLRLLDVIGQPYPPPESNEILILPEGIPLNERMIERLGRFTDGRVDAPPIYVHRPSSLAMHYNRNHRRIGAR